MLEVDALEGVAFYRLNNFAVLELVFLPNLPRRVVSDQPMQDEAKTLHFAYNR